MAALLYPAINRFGLSGAAATVVFAQTLTGLPALGVALSMVHAGWSEIVQALWFPSLNTALMAITLLAVQFFLPAEPTAVSLAVLVGTGIAAYLAAASLSTRMFGYVAPTDLLNRIRGAAS